MKKMKKEKKLTSYFKLGIIVIAVFAYSGFLGLNLYKQNNIDNYNGSVTAIQLDSAKRLSKLKINYVSFYVVPKMAKKLSPKFKEASLVTEQAAAKLKKITAPADYKKDHQKLIRTYQMASALYLDLHRLADHVIERDKVINELIKQLKYFASKVSKTKKSEEVTKLAKESENELKMVIKKINALKSPIFVYDESVLLKYSNSLIKHLGKLQSAIKTKDSYEVQMALYNIQLDL